MEELISRVGFIKFDDNKYGALNLYGSYIVLERANSTSKIWKLSYPSNKQNLTWSFVNIPPTEDEFIKFLSYLNINIDKDLTPTQLEFFKKNC